MNLDDRLLFENEVLVAVDKPAGVLSIPADRSSRDSIYSLVSAGYADRLYIIHRLDRATSGVILFAKTADAHRALSDQFSQRAVIKTYLALVHGTPLPASGRIDRPIRAFGSGRMGVDEIRGKPSQTRYRVIQRGDGYALVEVRPETGRRHQIRVHFYSLGHPLIGDRRYGEKARQLAFPRLMLHASSLTFHDPFSGSVIEVQAPVPKSFQKICDRLM